MVFIGTEDGLDQANFQLRAMSVEGRGSKAQVNKKGRFLWYQKEKMG
jgi:hypothetical protein